MGKRNWKSGDFTRKYPMGKSIGKRRIEYALRE
jgi:hypothetical protein